MTKEVKIFNIHKLERKKRNKHYLKNIKSFPKIEEIKVNSFHYTNSNFLNKIIDLNYYMSENLSVNTSQFVCFFENCEKSFKNFCRWKLHYQTHTNTRPYMCHICDKKFLERGNLNYHLNTHTEKRDFICEYKGCGYQFRTKGNLHRHLKLHQQKEKIRFKKFITRNKVIPDIYDDSYFS